MKISLAISIVSIVLFGSAAFAQDLQAYQFFSSKGEPMTYTEVVSEFATCDIALLGELHDHPVVHWIQKRLIADLQERRDLVLGGEFFERDNQLIVDEYLSGLVNDKRFEEEARLWPNYTTDYRPILQFARDSGIAFIATNVPRRYAALVAQHGLDTLQSLSAAAKQLLPKLPIAFDIATPGYTEMLDMMSGHGMTGKATYFVQAQAIKDAAMAEAIANNWKKPKLFLHINGDFHSANYGGIYHYLKASLPKSNILTMKVYDSLTMVFDESYKNSGNIVLVVAEDFTRTY